MILVLIATVVFFCGTDTDGDSRSGSKERLAEKKMQKPPPTRTITYKVRNDNFFHRIF